MFPCVMDPTVKPKEDVLDLVGGNGPWQRQIFVLILLCAVSLAGHNLCMTFFAPNIDHWCSRPPEVNISVQQWKLVAIPEKEYSCYRYKGSDILNLEANITSKKSTQLVPCESWEYDNSAFGSNILSEWDLVCDRAWLVSLSKSIFIAGYLVAVTVFGYLSDRVGRRRIIVLCNVIAVASALVTVTSVSFFMFAVCRFFIAIGVGGTFSTSFVLLMELIGRDHRSIFGMGVNFGWSFGFMMLPVVVWLIRDWIWVEVVIALPSIVFLFGCWFLPESPRWLIGNGRTQEAKSLLLKVAIKNQSKEPELEMKLEKMIAKMSKEQMAENEKASIFQLVSTPGLWQKTVIVFYLWFVNAFIYYGLSYNTNELAGDPFINFGLSGAVEIPAYMLSLALIHGIGRKFPQACTMIVGGSAALLMYVVPEDVWWVGATVSLVGKFCVSCSFSILYVYTAEIFPTVIRNASFGSASLCGRIGSIVAPFVRELGYASHPVVPQLLFGVLALVGGVLVFLLPETHRCVVPDTIREAAESSRKKLNVAEPESNSTVLKEFRNNCDT